MNNWARLSHAHHGREGLICCAQAGLDERALRW